LFDGGGSEQAFPIKIATHTCNTLIQIKSAVAHKVRKIAAQIGRSRLTSLQLI
jgi:hypothetical protein